MTDMLVDPELMRKAAENARKRLKAQGLLDVELEAQREIALMRIRPSLSGKLLCWLFGKHTFVEFSDGCKRKCTSCAREEWVHSNPYPKIGEPKYFWKHMPFEKLEKRRRS